MRTRVCFVKKEFFSKILFSNFLFTFFSLFLSLSPRAQNVTKKKKEMSGSSLRARAKVPLKVSPSPRRFSSPSSRILSSSKMRRCSGQESNNELVRDGFEEEEEEEEEFGASIKSSSTTKENVPRTTTTTTIDPFVLRETEDILAVYKPANLGFHSEFEDGLVRRLRKLKERDEHFYECKDIYPVHRLDKPTSGIVLFATKKSSAKTLSRAFENKRIVKYYIGVSQRKPRKKMGTVNGDLKKARRGMYKLMRTMENPSKTTFVSRGFSVVSSVEVEDSVAKVEDDVTKEKNNFLRFFLFKPETGKTHQIRVHAKSLGSALLGDNMYGSIANNSNNSVDRMYLHACAVRVPKLEVIEDEDEGGEKYETEPFQIVCAPHEGKYWGTDIFQEWFADKEEDYGPWFDDVSLLRSHSMIKI
tara:strand:- start:194 stop:1441 length:1248 start_codon:yes stop_codon:yes gene_type:complete